MYCKKCGNQISESEKFCTKCGTPADNFRAVGNSTPNYCHAEGYAASARTGADNIRMEEEVGPGIEPHMRKPNSYYQYPDGTTVRQPDENNKDICDDEAYKIAAKNNWYCFLLPILFFLPILDDKKNIPGNKDVANTTLWILILNVGINILRSIFSGIGAIYYPLWLLSSAVSIFAIVAFVMALAGKAICVPGLKDVKFFK